MQPRSGPLANDYRLTKLLQALLIGLMFYPNPLVFIQFHPVTYVVKLNIEMSMASLITRLAADRNVNINPLSFSQGHRSRASHDGDSRDDGGFRGVDAEPRTSDEELRKIQRGGSGIHRKFDVEVRIDSPKSTPSNEGRSSDEPGAGSFGNVGDEVSLTGRPAHDLPGAAWDATEISSTRKDGCGRQNKGSARR